MSFDLPTTRCTTENPMNSRVKHACSLGWCTCSVGRTTIQLTEYQLFLHATSEAFLETTALTERARLQRDRAHPVTAASDVILHHATMRRN